MQTKILDLSSVVGDNCRRDKPVALIASQMLNGQFRGPKIIFTTCEILRDEKIFKHLRIMERMQMLRRVVYDEIGISDVIGLTNIERESTLHRLVENRRKRYDEEKTILLSVNRK